MYRLDVSSLEKVITLLVEVQQEYSKDLENLFVRDGCDIKG